MDPRIGTEFAGHRIESVIGRGGASVVYLAEHLRLRRKVALKVLAPHLADDEAFRERFIRESRIAAGLDHPGVVTVYDAGEDEGSLYISMRYVEGSDLAKLIAAQGALQPQRVLSILTPIASALDVAHGQGLVHRDVKPANILVEFIASKPGIERAYLSDFGISKRTTSREGLTRTGQFVGTVDYVAPEQITGEPVDGRTDEYSLGCVLYEALTGKVPFVGETGVATIYSHLHDPPPTLGRPGERGKALDRVVGKALAKSRSARYDGCEEMLDAVRAELLPPTIPVGAATKAPDRGAGVHRMRPPNRRGVAALSVGAVVVIAAVVAITLALPDDGAERGGTSPSVAVSPSGSVSPSPPEPGEDPPSFIWATVYRTESSGLAGAAVTDGVAIGDVVMAVGHATPEGEGSGLDDAAVWRTEDGRQWHRVGMASLAEAGDQRMIAIASDGERLVAVGRSDSDAAVWTSVDLGETWIRSSSPSLAAAGLQQIRDVVSTGSGFVAVGTSGLPQQQDAAVWTWTGALEWERVESSAFEAAGDQELFAIHAVGDRLVAVGVTNELGDIDAAVWSFEPGGWSRVDPESLAEPEHQAMLDVAGGGRDLPLVAVGCEDPSYRCDTNLAEDADAVVWVSQDGTSWERVPAEGRLAGNGSQVMRALVAYRGALVAVGSSGGQLGDVDGVAWSSLDGVRWRAPTQSSTNVTALGGRGDQSLRAVVVYRRHDITLFGFGITQEVDLVDGGVWGASERFD